jgi:hypothetical protein
MFDRYSALRPHASADCRMSRMWQLKAEQKTSLPWGIRCDSTEVSCRPP